MGREERLIAYVDGELDSAARAAFEAELAADSGLAAEVAAHRALRTKLSATYDPTLVEAVPTRLTLAAEAANDPAPRRFRAPQWAAIAASLVAAVLVGRMVVPQEPMIARDGMTVAGGRLDAALDRSLAADDRPIRVSLTFANNQGQYCRTFASRPDHLAGVACRQGTRWAIPYSMEWRPPAEAQYRTAGSDIPPEVLEKVDEMIAGDPLDAAAERAARERRWKR